VTRYLGKYGSKGGEQSRDHLGCAPVPAQEADNPEAWMAVSLRDRESGGRRPLCVLHRVLQEFLQHRRFPGKRVSEQVVAGQLEGRG